VSTSFVFANELTFAFSTLSGASEDSVAEEWTAKKNVVGGGDVVALAIGEILVKDVGMKEDRVGLVVVSVGLIFVGSLTHAKHTHLKLVHCIDNHSLRDLDATLDHLVTTNPISSSSASNVYLLPMSISARCSCSPWQMMLLIEEVTSPPP
jgi:hypothetical protein